MGLLPQLNKLLIQAGIELTEQQKQQLVSYVEMLHKWNKAYNLTSVRAPEQMIIRHILDSIVVNEHLDGERFIDVGTGMDYREFLWLSFALIHILCYSIA